MVNKQAFIEWMWLETAWVQLFLSSWLPTVAGPFCSHWQYKQSVLPQRTQLTSFFSEMMGLPRKTAQNSKWGPKSQRHLQVYTYSDIPLRLCLTFVSFSLSLPPSPLLCVCVWVSKRVCMSVCLGGSWESIPKLSMVLPCYWQGMGFCFC